MPRTRHGPRLDAARREIPAGVWTTVSCDDESIGIGQMKNGQFSPIDENESSGARRAFIGRRNADPCVCRVIGRIVLCARESDPRTMTRAVCR